MTRSDRPRLHIRPMTLDDVDTVLAVDRLSFPVAWTARTYRYEIASNDKSTLLVVENPDIVLNDSHGESSLWERLFGSNGHANTGQMVGFCGFWQLSEESHVSTIAVHPSWRGNSIGDLMIWVMVRESIARRAEMVTLEVRVSNSVAQKLYRKYGFKITGRRKHYYRDNGEDAYLMTLTPLDEPYLAHLQRMGQLLAQKLDVSVTLPTAGPIRDLQKENH